MQINEHIEQKFRNLVSSKNNQAKQYFSNAKSDAIYCFDKIKKYISKDIQILEVGGGIHLLTDYLNENKYYINRKTLELKNSTHVSIGQCKIESGPKDINEALESILKNNTKKNKI